MIKYLKIVTLCLMSYTMVNAQTQPNQLALIDSSKQSMRWLDNHAEELINGQIPVMLLKGEQQDIQRLMKRHHGLLIGTSPKPDKFLPMLLKQLNVTAVPVIVSTGKAEP